MGSPYGRNRPDWKPGFVYFDDSSPRNDFYQFKNDSPQASPRQNRNFDPLNSSSPNNNSWRHSGAGSQRHSGSYRPFNIQRRTGNIYRKNFNNSYNRGGPGNDNISSYVNVASMLENPWEDLEKKLQLKMELDKQDAEESQSNGSNDETSS